MKKNIQIYLLLMIINFNINNSSSDDNWPGFWVSAIGGFVSVGAIFGLIGCGVLVEDAYYFFNPEKKINSLKRTLDEIEVNPEYTIKQKEEKKLKIETKIEELKQKIANKNKSKNKIDPFFLEK